MSDEESEVIEQPDAVVVIREIGPEGDVACRVSTAGDVRSTEIATILEMGLKRWRREAGLS